MTTFVIQKKYTQEEIEKLHKEALDGIGEFFANNPKRRVCKAKLYYGQVYKIRRKHIFSDLGWAKIEAEKRSWAK